MDEFLEKYGDDILACVIGGIMIVLFVGIIFGPFSGMIGTFIGRIF